jgi:hypothetical protein
MAASSRLPLGPTRPRRRAHEPERYNNSASSRQISPAARSRDRAGFRLNRKDWHEALGRERLAAVMIVAADPSAAHAFGSGVMNGT